MTLHVRTLSEREALQSLDADAVKKAIRSVFAGLSAGATVQPAQTVIEFPDGRGDCIFYPGLLHDLDLVGVKVSPFIAQRSNTGLAPVTAYTLLLSASTGEPVLLVDSLELTAIRTAATTALAIDLLAAPTTHKLAVIGAGKVGLEHVRQASAGREWNEVSVYSPSLIDKSFENYGARRSALSEVAPHASIASSAAQAVADADVVMLCTSSAVPVIDIDDIVDGALVTSISTNSPRAHEIAPSVLSEIDVYCDLRATTPGTAGEMIIAAEAGWDPEQIKADLSELIGGYVPDTTQRRFFRSTGLGIEDLAIASLLR
ncbi:MAG: ornithine cyclodeaminase family protein [Rhodoglobus sp.]